MDGSHAVLDSTTYRALLKSGEDLPAGASLRKQYVCESVKAVSDRVRRFTITTGSVDRDKDTLSVGGWRVDNFIKGGGPVLWAHQYSQLPVGKSARLVSEAGAWKSDVEFAPADAYPFAETVLRLVDFGALRSTSVGFRPLKAAWNEERGGMDYLEQELLEFSIVPVPANPEALLDAKSAGVDCAPLKTWAEQILDGIEPGLWVPKAQALAVFKTLAAPQVSMTVKSVETGATLTDSGGWTKRGRVLSTANEAHIRSAHQAAGGIISALENVLQACDQPDEEPKAAAPVASATPAPVLTLAPSLPKAAAEALPITREEVVAAVTAAAKQVAEAAVRRASGRID